MIEPGMPLPWAPGPWAWSNWGPWSYGPWPQGYSAAFSQQGRFGPWWPHPSWQNQMQWWGAGNSLVQWRNAYGVVCQWKNAANTIVWFGRVTRPPPVPPLQTNAAAAGAVWPAVRPVPVVGAQSTPYTGRPYQLPNSVGGAR
jgi:hypothetical protein